ncbi:MAG: hypothetical protein ACRDFR_07575, partial [Candidatus Limnocylindria bacterium]
AIQLVLEDRMGQADILDVWIHHPWATAVVAGLVCLVSLRETGLLGVSASTRTRPCVIPGSVPGRSAVRDGSAGLGAGSYTWPEGGNKQIVLRAARDVAIAGDEEPIPVAKRPGTASERRST